ncbi:hypothetical protein L210DRAFT_972967 [Boletus edulis BED1]|uniref:Uncharacterized protein n=1 Tax=Boletus edulis BED1 TaxID=1328754 RepID=A0AAD4BR18_BOLED|nr:hypothetical protein L210DRAFT_972967 [Boletus edulis BED1]
MAITKAGKQTIPANTKDIDAPATQRRCCSLRANNHFAPLAQEEEDMDLAPDLIANNTQPHITPSLQAHLAVASEHRRITTVQTHVPCPGAFPPHTAKPIDGFPITHLWHSAQLFEDMDPKVIATWDAEVPSPKLLACIFDLIADKASPDTIRNAITAMKNVIHGINCEVQQISTSNIKVAPLARAEDAHSAPATFLIYDIPETVHNILIHTKVWATPAITFELFPFTPTFPTFLFAIEGFMPTPPIRIHTIILSTWHMDKTYDDFIRIITRDPEFPADFPPHIQMEWFAKTFETMASSLEVCLLDYKKPGNIPDPIYNVFAEIPTTNPRMWHEIRSLLENLTYVDPLNGTGKRAPFRQCQLCHCVTHPRGLCLFPRIDEWLGPNGNSNANTMQKDNKCRGKRGN